MRVETLTPVVAAAPGGRARWRLRIENDGPAPVGYRIRVVGFDPANVLLPPPRGPLLEGWSEELDLDLLIPDAFAAGHHSIAVEVTPDRAGDTPVVAGITVSVGSVDDLAVAVVPSTVRGRRRATFRVDIDNRSDVAREVELEADSAGLQIRLQPDRVLLAPNERVRTTGRIKAPRHLMGEPHHHSLTVAARSNSAPIYAPATFQQRALFPRGLRTMLAVALIVGIWGGALGAGYLWWQSRGTEKEATGEPLVDLDGDGIPETPGGQLVDTDGDGVPDTAAAVVAEQQAAGGGQEGAAQAGGSDLPTRTSMGGTVATADGGEATGVAIALTPIDVGAPPPDGATQLGFRGGRLEAVGDPPTAAKFWPARFGRYEPDVSSGFRRTESVADTTSTDKRGVWFFGSVSVGQSYEVSFSRPGFDTQAFVVTPSADGKPIDLPVEMEPAKGAVRGSVSGPGGGIGNVKLELSDGTLVFDSATASDGDAGTFSFTGVSTPGTYSLRATAPGLGTEVVQVTLEEGEERGGVTIRMRPGVGSISGRVTAGGKPLGGVTMLASNGETTVTTTSLTEGATGTFLFPRLEIPGSWTIEARLDGYVTQTRLVDLTGNANGVDFALTKRTASVIGLVQSSNGGPLPGVNIRVSRDDLFFESQSAVSPDPGSFTITDLPPGTYLVELSRYDHEPTSLSVTVRPGQVVDLGTITLVYRPRPDIAQNAGLEVRVVQSDGNPITPSATAPGATVRVYRSADDTLVGEQVGTPDQSSFFFQPLPIGTYRIEVTRGVTYRLATRRTSIGLSDIVEVITIYLLGQVHGRLVDSFTGATLVDYDVQIRRLNPDGTTSIVQNIPVTTATEPKLMPDGSLQVRFETSNPPGLTSGQYLVVVDNPPPGYKIRPDQVLVPGQPPMQFQIRPDDDTPIDLGSILADRYPEIHGAVLAPRLGAAPPEGGPAPISFVPIDDDALTVTLTCPGADPLDAPSVLTLPNPDPSRPYSGSELSDGIVGSGAGLDTFYIDPIDVEERDLFGACQLSVSAPQATPDPTVAPYVAKTFDVFVDAVRGAHAEIHRNVALVKDRDVAGTAYWIDDGPTTTPDVPADGVTVRLQGDTVTGFQPGTVPYDSAGSEPVPQREDIAASITDGAGGWAFPADVIGPRQVFGDGAYVFERPGYYVDRIVGLTIDEDAKVATAVSPPPGVLALADDGSEVQLDANGADITATLAIRTVKGSGGGVPALDVAGFTAALTGANARPGTISVTAPYTPATGTQPVAVRFGVTPDPGTHQWTVTSPVAPDPARPRFVPLAAGDAAPSPTFFQAPAQTVAASPSYPQLTKTYVEMGALGVEVVDATGTLISGAAVDISTAGGPTIRHLVDATAPVDNVEHGLPVNLAERGSSAYTVALSAVDNPRLDVGRATVEVFDDAGNRVVTGCPLASCPIVTINQGGQPRVRITVPRFGTLSGNVCGVRSAATVTCERLLTLAADDPEPGLVVTATLVAVPQPGNPSQCVDPPGGAVAATVVPVADGAPGSFELFGPPGYYRVSVTHPDYDPIPGEFGDQEDIDLECRVVTLPFPFPVPKFQGQPVYQLRNDVDRGWRNGDSWRLLRKRSDVTITVVNDTLLGTRGAPIVGAEVTVTSLETTDPPPAPIVRTTNDDGVVPLTGDDGRLPGDYEVAVRNAGYFPLILRVRITGDGGGSVAIDVPLPRVGGSIIGDVVARNSEGDALLAPVGVTVSDVYDQPDAVVTGATVLGVDDPAQPAPPTYSTPPTTPPGLLARYSFTGLGSGTHRLSYAYDNSAGVYASVPPAEVSATVLSPGTTAPPDAVFEAANRDVVIAVTSTRDVTGALVRLVDPDSGGVAGPPVAVGACPDLSPPIPGAQCVTFEDLPPELVDYRVLVSKELFATASVPFPVAPGASDVVIQVPLTLAGNTARVIGTAVQVEDGASPPTLNPAPAGTTIRLIRLPGTLVATTAAGGGGSFTFDITSTGSYAIEADVAGYAPRPAPVTIGPDDLGTTLDPPVVVQVEKFATFEFDVAGEDLDTGTVTAVGMPTGPGAPATLAPVSTSGGRFMFEGDPAWSYRFRFTSTQGYAVATVPPAASPAFEPAVGSEETVDVTLLARTIGGTVAGGAGGTVRLVSTGSTVVAGPAPIASDDTYTLAGPIPAGTYTVVAERFGTGRDTLPAVTVADTDGNLTGRDLALGARNVAVTFSSIPAGATVTVTSGAAPPITGAAGPTPVPVPESLFPVTYVVSSPGSISSPPATLTLEDIAEATSATRWNATALTATVGTVTLAARTISGTANGTAVGTVRARSGASTVVGNVADADGAFTLTGPFPPASYTIVGEELGLGRATVPVTVADDAAPSPADVTLTLAPRDVGVTFTSSPPGASIAVTTSAASGSRTITGTAGTAIAVPENAFPISYVASLPGYQSSAAATVDLSPAEAGPSRWNLDALTQSVSTPALIPRSVSGTFTGATAAGGASVRAVNGSGGVVSGPVSVGAGGAFTLPGPIAAGSYTLVGEQLGLGRGTAPLTIADESAGNVTGQTVTPLARIVAVTFTLPVPPASGAVAVTGVSSTYAGTTGTAINISEDQFPIGYTVSATGFIPGGATSVALAPTGLPADRWNLPSLTMRIDVVALVPA